MSQGDHVDKDTTNMPKVNIKPTGVAFLLKAEEYLMSHGYAHTRQDIADRMGVDKARVSRAFSGKNSFTMKFLDRFNQAYDEVFNLEYLATGEGPMLRNQPATEAMDIPLHSLEARRIPIVPIKAQAGYGKGFLYDSPEPSQDPDDLYEEFEHTTVILDTLVSDRYKVFEVSGDSMTDGTPESIRPGDRILCREVQLVDLQWSQVNRAHPYVVVVLEEEGILIKQLVAHNTATGVMRLHSLNPEYPDFEVSVSQLRAFFSVEKLIEREL